MVQHTSLYAQELLECRLFQLACLQVVPDQCRLAVKGSARADLQV